MVGRWEEAGWLGKLMEYVVEERGLGMVRAAVGVSESEESTLPLPTLRRGRGRSQESVMSMGTVE